MAKNVKVRWPRTHTDKYTQKPLESNWLWKLEESPRGCADLAYQLCAAYWLLTYQSSVSKAADWLWIADGRSHSHSIIRNLLSNIHIHATAPERPAAYWAESASLTLVQSDMLKSVGNEHAHSTQGEIRNLQCSFLYMRRYLRRENKNHWRNIKAVFQH